MTKQEQKSWYDVALQTIKGVTRRAEYRAEKNLTPEQRYDVALQTIKGVTQQAKRWAEKNLTPKQREVFAPLGESLVITGIAIMGEKPFLFVGTRQRQETCGYMPEARKKFPRLVLSPDGEGWRVVGITQPSMRSRLEYTSSGVVRADFEYEGAEIGGRRVVFARLYDEQRCGLPGVSSRPTEVKPWEYDGLAYNVRDGWLYGNNMTPLSFPQSDIQIAQILEAQCQK